MQTMKDWKQESPSPPCEPMQTRNLRLAMMNPDHAVQNAFRDCPSSVTGHVISVLHDASDPFSAMNLAGLANEPTMNLSRLC
jgi:hypothetical protein